MMNSYIRSPLISAISSPLSVGAMIIVFILMLGSFLYVTDAARYIAFACFGVGGIGIVGAAALQYKFSVDVPLAASILTFFILSAISSIFNNSPYLLFGVLYILIIFLSSCVLGGSKEFRLGSLVGFYLACATFLICGFFINLPTTGISYSGAAYNPNSMGGILAVCMVVIFSQMCGNLLRRRWTLVFAAALLLMVLSFLLLYTRSRASIAGFAVAAFATIVLTIAQMVRERWPPLQIAIIVVSPIAVMLMFSPELYYGFLEKNVRKAGHGDISDGRFQVWVDTINHASILGNGRDAFGAEDVGAHNTFISILGQYGWLAAIAFVAFIGVALWKSYQYAQADRDSNFVFVPFACVLSFSFLALFEGMLMKAAMFSMLIFSAASSTRERNEN